MRYATAVSLYPSAKAARSVPGIEPRPPRMTIENALIMGKSPIVGWTVRKGETSTPAAAGQSLRPGFHSTWQQQSPYLIMAPGQISDFWIRFSNSGTEPWVRGVWGKQANLGLNGDDRSPYALGMAANWLWEDRIATTTAAVVQPGDIAEFRFSVRAPMTRGVYRLNLRPVIDGTVWMEDQGVFWIIEVR